MSEVQAKFDNVITRLGILGASDEQIEWVTKEWDSLDEDLPEGEREADREARREGMYRLNDAVLSQMIVDGQSETAQAEIDNSRTPVTNQALADADAERKAQEESDWNILALAIPTILDTVGENAELAWRLHELESTANVPRKTLLADLEKIAWPHGRPEIGDGEAVSPEDAALAEALDDAGEG